MGGHTCLVIIASQPLFMQLEVFSAKKISQLQIYQGRTVSTIWLVLMFQGPPG